MNLLLFTLVLIVIGFLIWRFWVPILVVGAIIFGIISLAVCAAVTAITLEFIEAVLTGVYPDDFKTYFWYSLIFFVVVCGVYFGVLVSALGMLVEAIRGIFKKN